MNSRTKFSLAKALRPSHTIVPKPARSSSCQPSSIGPPLRTIDGISTVAAAIVSAGVVLSQPVVRITPSKVTMQNFNQTEIRQIPIQCRRRPSATFLDRMHGNSIGIPPASRSFLGAFYRFQMPPVTRRQVTADLSNPDDRPSGLQFLPRQSIVQIPLT